MDKSVSFCTLDGGVAGNVMCPCLRSAPTAAVPPQSKRLLTGGFHTTNGNAVSGLGGLWVGPFGQAFAGGANDFAGEKILSLSAKCPAR